MHIGNLVRMEMVSGEPLVRQDVRVTPRARILELRLPFGRWIWNHPESLLIERGGTREERVLTDVTLLSQVVLAATILLIPILFFTRWKGARQ